ncbi:MAG: ABC transporter ATP-binding protein [Helicobacteraceae bacterium]|nr:ABC transporter ATP-binding protein [Helicobacteraceae bacterium]
MSQAAAVTLSNIAFAWRGSDPVLKIANFTAAQGERLFISGKSGSGKSTLLGLIAGVLTPNEGEAIVCGANLNSLSAAKRDLFRAAKIGYIFQQFNLIGYLSILENVLLPRGFSLDRRGAIGEAEELLSRLGLAENLWRKKAANFSVGQQQRVAAARALIGSPPILIADEPTSALDYDIKEDFLRLLFDECDRAASTLLFVSHDRELARRFSREVKLAEINEASR